MKIKKLPEIKKELQNFKECERYYSNTEKLYHLEDLKNKVNKRLKELSDTTPRETISITNTYFTLN